MIKMSNFKKINDNSIVDTFKNVFQRGSNLLWWRHKHATYCVPLQLISSVPVKLTR